MKNWIAKFDGTEYAFLSNFYECQCEFEGVEYITSEHAYQAAKTLDFEKRAMIQNCATPGAAKRMGRRVELREDWEEVKDQVMLDVLHNKFKNNENMKEKLLATGDAILIEGNVWHDNYWGICSCEKCGGIGKNMLGTLLMFVRKVLSFQRLEWDKEELEIDKAGVEKIQNYRVDSAAHVLGLMHLDISAFKIQAYGEDPYNGA